MKNIGISIGVIATVFGAILLLFGNSIGIILLLLGILGAIANK